MKQQADATKAVGLRQRVIITMISLVAVAVIGSIVFAILNWHHSDENQDEVNWKLKDLEKQNNELEQDISALRKTLRDLERAFENATVLDCSVCDSYFVSHDTLNATVANLTAEIQLVNTTTQERIDLLEEEIFILIENGTLSNCTNFVSNQSFVLVVEDIESQIDAIQATNLLSGNNYAQAGGFIGPWQKEEGQIAPSFLLELTLTCYQGKLVSDGQLATTPLLMEEVDYPGVCPNTSQPLLFNYANTTTRFCPCEDGWYVVSMSIQNLYIARSTPNNGTFEVYDRGGSIEVGLVYHPPYYDEDQLFFNNGSWPLPPVISKTWENSGFPLNRANPEELYTDYELVEGINDFTPWSDASTQTMFLVRETPSHQGFQACYDLIMNVYDPFRNPDYPFCYADPTATVQYFFYQPVARGVDKPPYLDATLSIQKLAWSKDAPFPNPPP